VRHNTVGPYLCQRRPQRSFKQQGTGGAQVICIPVQRHTAAYSQIAVTGQKESACADNLHSRCRLPIEKPLDNGTPFIGCSGCG
jgi:hypothetical protein